MTGDTRSLGAPARRPGYYRGWLAGCLIVFIGAWAGINQAAPRSGLSYAMGWTIVTSLAGALVSLIRFLRARRRLRIASLHGPHRPA